VNTAEKIYIMLVANEVCEELWLSRNYPVPQKANAVVILGSYNILCSLADYCGVGNRDRHTPVCCVAVTFIQDAVWLTIVKCETETVMLLFRQDIPVVFKYICK